MLLLIDSRSRLNTTDNAAKSKFEINPAINDVRKVSLLAFDFPVPADALEEGVYYVNIDELGTNVRGVDGNDTATFVLFRESEPDTRTQVYHTLTFKQSFTINTRSISQLTCNITYRNASNETVTLTADFNMLLEINGD